MSDEGRSMGRLDAAAIAYSAFYGYSLLFSALAMLVPAFRAPLQSLVVQVVTLSAVFALLASLHTASWRGALLFTVIGMGFSWGFRLAVQPGFQALGASTPLIAAGLGIAVTCVFLWFAQSGTVRLAAGAVLIATVLGAAGVGLASDFSTVLTWAEILSSDHLLAVRNIISWSVAYIALAWAIAREWVPAPKPRRTSALTRRVQGLRDKYGK